MDESIKQMHYHLCAISYFEVDARSCCNKLGTWITQDEYSIQQEQNRFHDRYRYDDVLVEACMSHFVLGFDNELQHQCEFLWFDLKF